MKQLALSIAPNGGFTGFGPLGNLKGASGIDIFTGFISKVIGVLTIIAVIWFVFTFILGAIGMITAGSDKANVENARKKIINGITGLVIVIIATFVISLVGYLLGFDILNLSGMFSTITQ
jgi:hypothetical protein